jgi:hypothetical protein
MIGAKTLELSFGIGALVSIPNDRTEKKIRERTT